MKIILGTVATCGKLKQQEIVNMQCVWRVSGQCNPGYIGEGEKCF